MRVLYLQPYVPTYRAPLFSALDYLLRQEGGSLTVAASAPDRSMAQRRDEASGPWLQHVRTIPIPTPLGNVRYRDVRRQLRARPDVVVMELDPANLNAWAAVVRQRVPLVLWGHGKTFTAPERLVVANARALLARRARHVMTYTEAGRQALIGNGVPEAMVTAVGNSTDTRALRQALDRRRLSDTTVSEAFGVNVEGRRVFMYVGGLDADKRVPFLAAAARHAAKLDPRFLLLVAGSGEDEHIVRALDPSIARHIPRANLDQLADMFVLSRGVWMPGRVGLVAVDALTAGVPIHTTDFPYHAPEFDFLTIGSSAFLHANNPEAFAEGTLIEAPQSDTKQISEPPAEINIDTVVEKVLAVLTVASRSSQPSARN